MADGDGAVGIHLDEPVDGPHPEPGEPGGGVEAAHQDPGHHQVERIRRRKVLDDVVADEATCPPDPSIRPHRGSGGDGPGLEQPRFPVGQGPFDVHRPAVVVLDLLGEPRHRDHVAVRDGCSAALFAGEFGGGGLAGGGHVDADAFVADVSFDDAAAFDGEGVGGDRTRDDGLAEPPGGFDHHPP